jgi:AraC-like DNA-binding protein
MPDSVTSAFSEPEDFETAYRAEGCLDLLITGRGQFRARLTQVTLKILRLSSGEEQLSRIAFIATPSDMVRITLRMDRAPSLICGGIATREGEILTLGPGGQVHARTDGSSHWGAISLPVKKLIEYAGTLTGAPFATPAGVQRWRPSPGAWRHLRSLHAAAIRMAAHHPQALVDAKAAHGLEQQLIHAIVECLAEGSADTASRSVRRHQDIMVRFERLLHAQPDRDMRITEVCSTLGVSQRLLRSLCAEHLGMSPTSYDRLRRMSLVRHTLRRGDGAAASVSDVARRYGFRSPGRFAVNYHAAFGEPPSTTLQQGRKRSTIEP